MDQIRRVGRSHLNDREFFLSVASDLATWSPDTDEVPTPFVALLALDAEEATDEVLTEFATTLVSGGCRYVCAWGPDCERVHDVTDRAWLALHPDEGEWEEHFVMTTWHAKETLDDALYFAIIDAHVEGHDAASVVAVASTPYAEQIERRMADSDRLVRDVLDAET